MSLEAFQFFQLRLRTKQRRQEVQAFLDDIAFVFTKHGMVLQTEMDGTYKVLGHFDAINAKILNEAIDYTDE